MADYLPHFKPGQAITLTVATTAVVGGRLVSINGVKTVAPSGADVSTVVGVAGHDAAVGDPVLVFTRAGGVHGLTASAAITAGAKVMSAAAGKIATIGAGANPIGIALETATADGDIIDVLFI